jgi:ketosteroid isomerase-like protein
MTQLKAQDTKTVKVNLKLAARSLAHFEPGYWSALLDEDAVLEYPYGPLLQMPMRVVGKIAALAHLAVMAQRFAPFKFYDILVLPTNDPAMVIAEYTGPSRRSGARPDEVFIAFLTFRDGRLILFREFWFSLKALQVFGDNWPLK